jgi:hypothetical protein
MMNGGSRGSLVRMTVASGTPVGNDELVIIGNGSPARAASALFYSQATAAEAAKTKPA